MKTDLKKDEKIILEARPHSITLIGPFILALIFFLIGLQMLTTGEQMRSYGFLLSILSVIYYFYVATARRRNLIAVTNLRVVKESGVFSNNSKESPLEKINNINFNQSLMGKMWGYGVVVIQTAATKGDTLESSVKNPKLLKDTITQMQEEYKATQIQKQAQELAKAIASGQQNNKVDVAHEIEKLHDLKLKGILSEDEFTIRKAKILNS